MTENVDATSKLSEPSASGLFDLDSRPIPATSIAWFREGFQTPLIGLKQIFKLKGLFWYFIIPVAIQTVVSLLLLGLMYWLATLLAGWVKWLIEWSTKQVFALTNQAESVELSSWAETLIHVAVWAPIVLFFLYVFVIAWRLTGGVLTGYFGGRLTDRALRAAGYESIAGAQTTFFGEILAAWSQAALIAVPTSIVGGALNLIPIVGPLVAVVGIWSYTIFVTGYDELRDPLQKMGHTRLSAFHICWRKRAATLGLGFAKLASAPIPLVGGIVQAAESLGRISLAIRIQKADA